MQANPKQQEAIEKINWPLLIIAWAGSWKTATLTKRVENMIKNHDIDPASILMYFLKEMLISSYWDEID